MPTDLGVTNRPGRPPRAARDPQCVEPHAHLQPGARRQPLRAVPGRGFRRCAICRTASISRSRMPISRRSTARCTRPAFVPVSAGGDHSITYPIFRAHRGGAPIGDGARRCPHRHLGRILRLEVHARRPVSPGGGGGPARSEAHHPDRHSRRPELHGRHRVLASITACGWFSWRSSRRSASSG